MRILWKVLDVLRDLLSHIFLWKTPDMWWENTNAFHDNNDKNNEEEEDDDDDNEEEDEKEVLFLAYFQNCSQILYK